ncbi:MAG: DUF1700 domain-containing protein [Lachnospiraceae bacterium]|nr:DUF1700 domain-containing protein [Lachnospiraceae bacterium]
MNKTEFLDALSEKLSEDLPPAAVQEQVDYYRGFIDGELKKGRTEEEVTYDLGEPILIARNLVESPQSYRVNNTSTYEQGMAEAEYPDTRGLMSEAVHGDSVPENANSYAEAFTPNPDDYNGPYAGPYAQGSFEKEGSARGYKEAERNRASFDNGFFESGQKQTIEKGGPSSIFKRADGGMNWRLISAILLVVLIAVAVVAIAAKVVVTFWPIILVMLIISFLFSRNDGR